MTGIEQRVDQTVEQSASVRQRLLEDLRALELAVRRAQDTARELPEDTDVVIRVNPSRRRWPWQR